MNNTFNLQRFGFLFRKTLFERPVQLFGLTLLSIIAVLIIYVLFKNLVGYEEMQNLSFLLGLIGGGTVLASNIFGHFSSGAEGISFLTLPASAFEKWLSALLINGVLYTATFILIFHLADLAIVHQYHSSLDPKSPFYQTRYDAVRTFELTGFVAAKGYIMFVNFTGAMVVGSLYFNKVAFIKVALIACGLFIGAHLLDQVFAKAIFDKVDKALPYYCVFIPVGDSFGKVELSAGGARLVDTIIKFILPGNLMA